MSALVIDHISLGRSPIYDVRFSLQSRWLPLTFTESSWNVAEPMTSSDIHRITMKCCTADDFFWHSQNHHEMFSTEPMTSSDIHRIIMKCCRADDFLWHSQNHHEMLQSRWLPLAFTESSWNVAEPITSSDIHRILMNVAEPMTSSDIHRILMKCCRANDFLWHSQNHHEMLLPICFCCITVFHKHSPRSSQQNGRYWHI